MTKKRPFQPPLLLRIIRWVFPKLEHLSPRLSAWYFEKLFFTPFRYKTPLKELEAESSAKLFSLSVEGKKIQCYQWGDDNQPYVLVVHGWAGRATQFRKFIEPLNEAGYNVIGFDGPAHGKSEGKQTTIRDFENVIKAIVAAKGNPAAIIAHSFGGGAAVFAIANGLPVKKLINVASPTIADRIIQSYLKALGGTLKTGELFKLNVQQKIGKPFEEFTTLHLIKKVPSDLQLLVVHDEEDKDVEIIHVKELLKIYPAQSLITQGLGHNRILKDDQVITHCVNFIKQ